MAQVPLANIQAEFNECSAKEICANFSTKISVNHQNLNEEQKATSINLLDNEQILQATNEEEEEDDEEELLGSFSELDSNNPAKPGAVCSTLEELVAEFDEKIVNCFIDYEQPIEQLAPVQVLSQEEIIQECRMWKSITASFGHVLPVDWGQTHARLLQLRSLLGARQMPTERKLSESSQRSQASGELDEDQLVLRACNYANASDREQRTNAAGDQPEEDEETQEQLIKDFDFHSLILCSGANLMGNCDGDSLLPFTAEQVLQEIDVLLQEGTHQQTLIDSGVGLPSQQISIDCIGQGDPILKDTPSEEFDSGLHDLQSTENEWKLPMDQSTIGCLSTSMSSFSLDEKINTRSENKDSQRVTPEELQTLSICQLNELYLEMERLIQHYSEVLIAQLALRDELEFEKELKNQFISLLLSVQAKRRKQNLQRRPSTQTSKTSGPEPGKYLTTVIPYNATSGCPSVPTLQVLIKILKAINEDSPAVPGLLTDFILKVLCPT